MWGIAELIRELTVSLEVLGFYKKVRLPLEFWEEVRSRGGFRCRVMEGKVRARGVKWWWLEMVELGSLVLLLQLRRTRFLTSRPPCCPLLGSLMTSIPIVCPSLSSTPLPGPNTHPFGSIFSLFVTGCLVWVSFLALSSKRLPWSGQNGIALPGHMSCAASFFNFQYPEWYFEGIFFF